MIYYQVNKGALSGVHVVCSVIKFEDNELEVYGCLFLHTFQAIKHFQFIVNRFLLQLTERESKTIIFWSFLKRKRFPLRTRTALN